MNVWLETLTGLMRENLWFAPVLSLVAGVVTSFTPCSLSAVPMILAYVGAVSYTHLDVYKRQLSEYPLTRLIPRTIPRLPGRAAILLY